jgi:hypothetical protein
MVHEWVVGKRTLVFFSPDSRVLIISRGDEFSFWDVETLKPIRRLARDVTLYPGYVAFSPDGKLMALEMAPAVVHLKEVATGRTVAKLEDPHSDRATWQGFTPDGTTLVVVAHHSSASHIWDLRAIRARLKKMNLDWDWPEFPPVATANLAAKPVIIEVRPASGQRISAGDLSGLTAEERLARYRDSLPPTHEPVGSPPTKSVAAGAVRSERYPGPPPVGWSTIAAQHLERLRNDPPDSHLGLRAAVYTLLDGDEEGYRDACRLMLRRYATTENLDDAERTAKICLLRDFGRAEARPIVEFVGRRLDEGAAPALYVPWGYGVRALSALRNRQPARAMRWADRGIGWYSTIVRAMAEHALGRHVDARGSLERARLVFGGDVRAFLSKSASDPYAAERENGAQVDLLFGALLFREAEVLIVFDRAFPADPFVGDGPTADRKNTSPRAGEAK